MKKKYTFKCEIVDEQDNVISTGTTHFAYEDVGTFGDCEMIDEVVGKVTRSLVKKVEEREALHELEEELIESSPEYNS